jgi:hypothetical protein
MRKLIKQFNNKYGKAYGRIDETLTNETIYLSYRIIKSLCAKDKDMIPYLKSVKLPTPKSPIETMLYIECLKENRVSWDDLLDAPFGTTNQNIKAVIELDEFLYDDENYFSLGNSMYYLLTSDDNYQVFADPTMTEIYVDGKKLDIPLRVEGYCIVNTIHGLALDLSVVYGNYYQYSCGYEKGTEHICEIVSYHTIQVENELTSNYLNIEAILNVFKESGEKLPSESLDLEEVQNSIDDLEVIGESLSEDIESVNNDLQSYKRSVLEYYTPMETHNSLAGEVSDNTGDILILQQTVQELPTEQDVKDLIASQIAGDDNALNDYVKKTELHAVATSGDYNDLRFKPDIVSEETIINYDSLILEQAKAYVDEQLDGLADILDKIEGGESTEGDGNGE